jgi:hypothetical protein
MKEHKVKTLVILGLIAATFGFGNFLLNQGGAQRIMNATKQSQNSPEAAYIEISPTPLVSPSPEFVEEIPSIMEYSFTATISGQTAFELLTSNVEEVEYTEYDFGTFIESIGGIAGSNEKFWAFYLNKEKAQAGADVTVLEEGDQVQFIYEEIEF